MSSAPIPKKAPTKARPKKLEHGTSASVAFKQLRELIVHGQLSPGARIVEGDLARRLNISRTPIRAALNKLQQEGFIHDNRTPNKSRMIVAPLTREDAAELYSFLGRIEGLAGRTAAALPRAERAKVVQQLKALNQQLADIKNHPAQQAQIFEIDRDFHRALVAVAGPRLNSWHRAIEPQAERYWRLYANSILSNLQLCINEHNDIIRALTDGDANRLEHALQLNWENGCSRLAGLIEIFGERGSW